MSYEEPPFHPVYRPEERLSYLNKKTTKTTKEEVETTVWLQLGSRSGEAAEGERRRWHSFGTGLFAVKFVGPAALFFLTTVLFFLLSLSWWQNCLLALASGVLIAIFGSIERIEDPSRATAFMGQLNFFSFKGEFKLRKLKVFLKFLWRGSSKVRTFLFLISPIEVGNIWLWLSGYEWLLEHPVVWLLQALVGFLAWRVTQKIHQI